MALNRPVGLIQVWLPSHRLDRSKDADSLRVDHSASREVYQLLLRKACGPALSMHKSTRIWRFASNLPMHFVERFGETRSEETVFRMKAFENAKFGFQILESKTDGSMRKTLKGNQN